MITVAQLAAISQNPDPVAFDLAGDVEALAPEMRKAKITTKPRLAAFLANVCQETDRLKTLEEYGDERYFRSFLGDQWRYHGRGYLMNTWKAAYANLSRVLGVDLVKNPDRLSEDKDLAARAAVWFWTENNINRYAGAGHVEAVSSIIKRGQVVPSGSIKSWDMRVYFSQEGARCPRGRGDGDEDAQGTCRGSHRVWPEDARRPLRDRLGGGHLALPLAAVREDRAPRRPRVVQGARDHLRRAHQRAALRGRGAPRGGA